MKYEFIAELDAEKAYSVAFMCRNLSVSRSGYYEWCTRPASENEKWSEELKLMITAIFDDSHGTYGHRRVHAVLVSSGHQVDDDTVRKLMRELDLVPCQPKPWWPVTTDADIDHRIPDLVARDFTATAPGEKFVSDITYIRTKQGWLYLATVLDCYTKMVAGWSMSDHYRTPVDRRRTRYDRDPNRYSTAGDIPQRSRLELHQLRFRKETATDEHAAICRPHRSMPLIRLISLDCPGQEGMAVSGGSPVAGSNGLGESERHEQGRS